MQEWSSPDQGMNRNVTSVQIAGLRELRFHLVTLDLRPKSYLQPVSLDLAKHSADKDADWPTNEL
jgi:hypothetical protein